MKMDLLLKNCRRYDSDETVDITIAEGKIQGIGQVQKREKRTEVIDAAGRRVAPGFIDVHIQGAGGADILDGSSETLQQMSTTLARLGVTGFLATTVMKPETQHQHLKVAAECTDRDLGGARILGIHLEGPFINPIKRGGISPAAIYPASEKALQEILDICGDALRMMTIAPELPGNDEMITKLRGSGVITSFGHSNARYTQARAAFEGGIDHVTHIFNAMPSLHHREPGPLLAILESHTVTAQMISDGVHLHPRIINYLYTSIGLERCICITDGIQAMGLPDGRYLYNGREYRSHNGEARYDDGTLIGTSLSVWEIALRFRKFTGCSLKQAIDTITIHPARVLGIEKQKGSLDVGKDADLVLLDDDSVSATIIGGNVVYRNF